MSTLMNWELVSERKLEVACAALKLIIGTKGSRAIGVFNHHVTLCNLFTSNNVPLNVQLVALEGVTTVMREI